MAEILLGLGSNCDARLHLSEAIGALRQELQDLRESPWYESAALNNCGDNYLNLVVAAHTDLSIAELLDLLKQLEIRAGRIRKEPDCKLDIDLLCYGDQHGRFADCELPRRDIVEHAHVLKPLADLLPEACHPTLNRSYASLWSELADSLLENQTLWRL